MNQRDISMKMTYLLLYCSCNALPWLQAWFQLDPVGLFLTTPHALESSTFGIEFQAFYRCPTVWPLRVGIGYCAARENARCTGDIYRTCSVGAKKRSSWMPIHILLDTVRIETKDITVTIKPRIHERELSTSLQWPRKQTLAHTTYAKALKPGCILTSFKSQH